ncbi:HAL/PAL/TAL family ammonia-lyase [Niabella beijingensis]|uniref:HAL/PAL/TAL family ammonia-lyase n=1 Tax=Niabella beijingensis TaxID=2872700 RepID=UPI001CBF4204|nr:aromatic amino acid ammonia-lyase [Niabella beijingensis]MBZ4188683.1 aromatic amino acid ammonia-lyase [Niabella beijingensis]
MITVGEKRLSLQDFNAIIIDGQPVTLDEAALQRVNTSFEFLKQFSSHKLIYGINTGFGPMAQYKISDENILELQYNLIRSHSSGGGNVLSPLQGKAVMLARLNNLMQGYSGVDPRLVTLLAGMISNNLIPCIYEHGGVGASGDLVQLAHLALGIIGEGEVWYENTIQPAAEAFKKAGLEPLKVQVREGLALINGTSAMTGVGLLNLLQAQQLLNWSIMLSAITNEIMEVYDDHYSHELNIVKHHTGQQHIARQMRTILEDSKLIRSRSEHLYNPENIQHDVFEDKVQEYYSLRCITQVLGPVYDTLANAEETVVNELNSVNDNPVVDVANHNIFHGGNFHGDYVSFEMDKMKIAITKLTMLSERQLNYLLNARLNQKFPPFVNHGILGLNFGMQGIQFTATSTTAENQTLSFPMYVHSIPNNNDNQDIVSMGFNAAQIAKKVIENAYEVLAIQAMTLLQAIDYLDRQEQMASKTTAIYTLLRKEFPKFSKDYPLYKDLARVRDFMKAHQPF